MERFRQILKPSTPIAYVTFTDYSVINSKIKNICSVNNILTVGDLVAFGLIRLGSLKGMGRKSYDAIVDWMLDNDLPDSLYESTEGKTHVLVHDKTNRINWEERRFQIICAVLPAYIAQHRGVTDSESVSVELAINTADKMIEMLKSNANE